MPYGMLLIFIILFITVLVVTIISWNNFGTNATYITETEDCSISLETSLDITTYPNCYIGGTITASKYVPQLDMTVNPIETYYLNVCAQYCSSGFNGTSCIDSIGQESFDNCISISKPDGCNGLSLPVAVSGITFYYPYGARNICDT